VNRRIYLLAIALGLALAVSACSSPAPAAPQTAATSAPTTSAGPAATRTVVAVPAQPTSATLAPRAAVAFVTPTTASLLQGGTPLASFAPAISGPSGVSVPAAPAAAAPTSAPAAAAPAVAGPVPTAPGVATGKRSEVKFTFLTALKPAEEAEPPDLVTMRAEFKKVPGFLEVSDIDEGIGCLVGYDAGLVTPEQLMVKFSQLLHPVKR
jgi:hypothetical protein